MTRPRACGALIYGDTILMVRHVEPTRSYWTLPGGGVEAGHSFQGNGNANVYLGLYRTWGPGAP